MSDKTLSHAEIALHWVVAIGMIALIGVGLYMSENEVFALYPVHKSIGMLLFVVILVRAVIRLRKGWPEDVSTGAAWEHILARLIHWVLIIGTIVMPISGMMDAYGAGRGLTVFGVDLVAANLGADGKPVAISAAMSGLGETLHGIVGKLLIGAILLHVAGALKHHVIDRDATLRRMLGRG